MFKLSLCIKPSYLSKAAKYRILSCFSAPARSLCHLGLRTSSRAAVFCIRCRLRPSAADAAAGARRVRVRGGGARQVQRADRARLLRAHRRGGQARAGNGHRSRPTLSPPIFAAVVPDGSIEIGFRACAITLVATDARLSLAVRREADAVEAAQVYLTRRRNAACYEAENLSETAESEHLPYFTEVPWILRAAATGSARLRAGEVRSTHN
eukprot:6173574-Pleurochrysis_carterae.AAC.3